MDGTRVLPGFEDLDKADVYKKSEDYIAKEDALNFAVEYDSNQALVALDLGTTAVNDLLKVEFPGTRTRWINLWCPEKQKETVKSLAKHYNFSPRLLALMTSDPEKPVVAAMEHHQSRRDRVMQRWKLDRPSFESQAADIEMLQGLPEPASHATNPNLNHYRIVNEVWYYCSVDWGSKCRTIQISKCAANCGQTFAWVITHYPSSNPTTLMQLDLRTRCKINLMQRDCGVGLSFVMIVCSSFADEGCC